MSQSGFCEVTGFHPTTISYWETGRRIPRLLVFVEIMGVLDVSADELLEGLGSR